MSTMNAIRVNEPGGPERLVLESIAIPEPGPGEVRVRIEAAGVNFIDVYQREGLYKIPTPYTPGMEGAGAVDAVGAGVVEWQAGDRVAYAMTRGSYAEYAIVPADKLVAIPDGVETQTAAALMLQGMTAHYLTTSTFPLEKGHTALIHAAAGGVGLLFTQIAKLRGATVYGTVSTEEKARLARDAGADEVILYTKTDFEAEVKRLTGGAGVDVVYDSVGKTTFEQSMRSLKPRGYLVLFGQASGPVEPIDPQVLNDHGALFLTRPSLAHHALTKDELQGRAGDLFRWVADGHLDVRIDRTFPLAQASAAHTLLQSRATSGKLLLIP